MEISFLNQDVMVNETDGSVTVCLRKNAATTNDIVLNVTAFQLSSASIETAEG